MFTINPYFKAVRILVSLLILTAAFAAVMHRPETLIAAACIGAAVLFVKRVRRRLFLGIAGTVYTEPNNISDVIFSELDMDGSREQVTVLTGQNLAIGTVVGKITLGAVSETHAGNTGNGVFTADVDTPRLANCQVGVYKAVCIVALPGGGTFRVTDPKGNVLGDVVVDDTFQNQLKFVIAAGAADFIEGDTFLITVAAGTGKIKILAPAALDGTQDAYGAVIADYDASAADVQGVAIVRDAILKLDGLVWPGGITADQKAAALAQLVAKGITTRTTA